MRARHSARFISSYPWGIASEKRHTVAFFARSPASGTSLQEKGLPPFSSRSPLWCIEAVFSRLSCCCPCFSVVPRETFSFFLLLGCSTWNKFVSSGDFCAFWRLFCRFRRDDRAGKGENCVRSVNFGGVGAENGLFFAFFGGLSCFLRLSAFFGACFGPRGARHGGKGRKW